MGISRHLTPTSKGPMRGSLLVGALLLAIGVLSPCLEAGDVLDLDAARSELEAAAVKQVGLAKQGRLSTLGQNGGSDKVGKAGLKAGSRTVTSLVQASLGEERGTRHAEVTGGRDHKPYGGNEQFPRGPFQKYGLTAESLNYGSIRRGYDHGTSEGTRRRRTLQRCTKKYNGNKWCTGKPVEAWHHAREKTAKKKWEREEQKIQRETKGKIRRINRKHGEVNRKIAANKAFTARTPKPIPVPAGYFARL